MFFKNRLSIDIRGHVVKAVEGKLIDDNSIKINKASYLDIKNIIFRQELLERCIQNGKLTNCKENTKAIKSFLRRNRFSTNKAILNISDDKVITKIVNFPKLSLHDLDDLINMQASKYFPVDLNNFYVDYRILGTVQENNKHFYKVLLCAIPRFVVREYTDLLIDCGLKPVLVDVHSNSISRNYKSLEFKDLAVIDGSIEEVDLLILERGNFYACTTFPFKLENYSELYKEPLQYDAKVLKDQISNLLKNVKNYINFYLSNGEDKNIDMVYITGDLALIQDIERTFEKELDIPVQKDLSELLTIKKPKKLNINENFYNGNLGILLRGE